MTDSKLRPGLALAALVVLGVAGLLASSSEPRGRVELEPDPDRPVERGADGCPEGLGPAMVRVPEGFCIDTTEVTRAQYAQWLDTSPSTDAQPSACAGNDDFTPSCNWPADEGHPVVCVDWCDARAFCEAAGKRLCGRVGGGGGYGFEGHDDPAVSEWHAACTSGGQYDYTYGDALDTAVCRGADAEDYTTWGLGETGSFAGCHSPEEGYAAIYDLSGNAAEWDDGCEGDGAEDACRIRGGSFQHHEHGLRCAMGQALRWPRTRAASAIGFRCCAD